MNYAYIYAPFDHPQFFFTIFGIIKYVINELEHLSYFIGLREIHFEQCSNSIFHSNTKMEPTQFRMPFVVWKWNIILKNAIYFVRLQITIRNDNSPAKAQFNSTTKNNALFYVYLHSTI